MVNLLSLPELIKYRAVRKNLKGKTDLCFFLKEWTTEPLLNISFINQVSPIQTAQTKLEGS